MLQKSETRMAGAEGGKARARGSEVGRLALARVSRLQGRHLRSLERVLSREVAESKSDHYFPLPVFIQSLQ